MLVHVARLLAKIMRDGIVFDVKYYFDGEMAACFEPPGAFASVGESDGWGHSLIVTSMACVMGIVKGDDVAEVGVYEAVVDDSEVE